MKRRRRIPAVVATDPALAPDLGLSRAPVPSLDLVLIPALGPNLDLGPIPALDLARIPDRALILALRLRRPRPRPAGGGAGAGTTIRSGMQPP